MKRIQAAKRLIGMTLALSLVLGILPMAALAAVREDGICPHHSAHDESCGYVEGSPCTHECGEACYQEVTECLLTKEKSGLTADQWQSYLEQFLDRKSPDANSAEEQGETEHVCSVESGCVTRVHRCIHTEHKDCGYVEAKRCDHVCKICDVQTLIDELPEEVTKETLPQVKEQLEAIDKEMEALTEKEREAIDSQKYDDTRKAVKELEGAAEEPEEEPKEETRTCTLTLNSSTPEGTVGEAYSGQITAVFTGDSQQQTQPQIRYAVSQGQLPEGITLNGETGALTGTPKASGSYAFTVTAQANAGTDHAVSASLPVTITIRGTETQEFTVALVGTVSKTYDGTTVVPETHGLRFELTGVAAGDDVSVTATFAYADAGVGENKAVTATAMKLTGKDAGKYTLVADTVTANVGTITKRDLTITATDSTVPYGKEPDVNAFAVTGLVDGHQVTVTLKGSTTNVTKNGKVTPENAVVKAGNEDVTGNYAITYVSGKLEITADLSAIEKLTVDNVTSADQAAIEKTQTMLKNADREGVDAKTLQQWDDAAKKCETLLSRIAEVKAENDRITNALKAYRKDTVTSADKGAITKLVQDIDTQLKSQNLTEGEKNTLTSQKQQANDLLKQIQAASDAVNTDAIRKTLGITVEKVERKDKTDLQQAIADLEKAQKDFGGNYTTEETKKIQAQLKNLKTCLSSIEEVEHLEADIEKLPKSVKPDEEAAEDALEAMEIYNALSDHQKSMVDPKLKEKVKKLAAEATDYKVTKGAAGKWSKGSYNNLSFTANGPYSKFDHVKVDGKKISTSYYTVKSGSTVVTLKSYYLRSLSDGKHTLTIAYDDGEAECIFYVLAKDASPGTGDSSNITLWIAILGVSAAALAGVFVWKKRSQKNKQ